MPLCTVIPVFIRNVKVNPLFSLYFQGFPAFSGALRVQIQTALLKTFFSLLSALLQSLVSLYFLPISTLYSCNSMNLQFSRTFPDKSDGFSNILFRPEKRFRRVSVRFFSLCVLKRKEEIYGSSRSGSFL